MRIALFELEDWEKDYFKEALKGHELLFFTEALDESKLDEIKDVEALVIFIYSRINKKIIDRLKNLKLIATMSTGYDHIDTKYCKKKGITVVNVPTYGENTVAEHTFALMLALSRKIFDSIERTHRQYVFETDLSLRGFDLKGKTLGIIGLGNIGKHVARIAKGFEMNVLVTTHHPDKQLEKRLGFKNVELNDLLKSSDVITLHVPYNKETHHLINKRTISKMKNGVYIINTARGSVIDTDALVEGLQSKKIAGAALDVLEEEDDIKEEKQLLKKGFEKSTELKTFLENHMLMKMNNVIITPHNAFNSAEALHRIMDTTISNIKEFMIYKKSKNQI